MTKDWARGMAILEAAIEPAGIKISNVDQTMITKVDNAGNAVEMVAKVYVVIPYPPIEPGA